MKTDLDRSLESLLKEADLLNKVLDKEPEDLSEAIFINNAKNILKNRNNMYEKEQ